MRRSGAGYAAAVLSLESAVFTAEGVGGEVGQWRGSGLEERPISTALYIARGSSSVEGGDKTDGEEATAMRRRRELRREHDAPWTRMDR